MPSLYSACAFTTALFTAVNAAKGTFDYNSLGDDWGKLSATCDEGKQQSPIDIKAEYSQLNSDLSITLETYADYVGQGKQLNMWTNLLVIQGDLPKVDGTFGQGGFTRTFYGADPAQFKPLQFHMHAPSEHTINGYHFDLELHVVHLFADGTLGGVLGIFFDRKMGPTDSDGNGIQNDFVQSLISPEPTAQPGSPRDVAFGTWIKTLDVSKFYTYPGSLTTPPCTEGVKWNVLMQVQSLSQDQFQYFADVWHHNPEFYGHGNYRRPQPMNGRIVQSSVTPAGVSGQTVYTGAQMMTAAATTLAAMALVHF